MKLTFQRKKRNIRQSKNHLCLIIVSSSNFITCIRTPTYLEKTKASVAPPLRSRPPNSQVLSTPVPQPSASWNHRSPTPEVVETKSSHPRHHVIIEEEEDEEEEEEEEGDDWEEYDQSVWDNQKGEEEDMDEDDSSNLGGYGAAGLYEPVASGSGAPRKVKEKVVVDPKAKGKAVDPREKGKAAVGLRNPRDLLNFRETTGVSSGSSNQPNSAAISSASEDVWMSEPGGDGDNLGMF